VQLIVEALDQHTLVSLLDRVESLGMTGVLEVHNLEEAERALDAGAKVIAINARDLVTSKIDRAVFSEISPGLPSDIVRIGEAGIRGHTTCWLVLVPGLTLFWWVKVLLLQMTRKAAVSDLVIAGSHPSCPARS